MKKLKEHTNNPQNTEGIYNSCDRWCEKCPFTSRCLNYKIYEERFCEMRVKTSKAKNEFKEVVSF